VAKDNFPYFRMRRNAACSAKGLLLLQDACDMIARNRHGLASPVKRSGRMQVRSGQTRSRMMS
jgi:hypothetical protein